MAAHHNDRHHPRHHHRLDISWCF